MFEILFPDREDIIDVQGDYIVVDNFSVPAPEDRLLAESVIVEFLVGTAAATDRVVGVATLPIGTIVRLKQT